MLSDLELWSAAIAKDEHAVAELCRLAQSVASDELRRKHVAADEIADLIQEAVASVLAYLQKGGRLDRDLRTFLKFRAWGVLSDHRKRMRVRRATGHADDEFAAVPATSDGGTPSLEPDAALLDCVRRLTETYRVVVELRYMRGRDTHEIAAELDITENAVHIRVCRALERLRECLQRKGVWRIA